MKIKGKSEKEKHEFALYVDYLSSFVESLEPGDELLLSDDTLFRRMAHVLRLKTGDACILFDQSIHVHFIIDQFIGKNQIQGVMHTKENNTILEPKITFLLPLLKRDDFDQALYALTEIGVSTIQLVITQKAQRAWGGLKEYERAQRIIIAAAEQSKNFAFPLLKQPIPLSEAIAHQVNTKIFFDPRGLFTFDVMQKIYQDRPHDTMLLIGPEGDLSNEEKKIVKEHNFIFCALTPTILRSVQAAALGAGIIRSVFYS